VAVESIVVQDGLATAVIVHVLEDPVFVMVNSLYVVVGV
jgi:hypothetical protein